LRLTLCPGALDERATPLGALVVEFEDELRTTLSKHSVENRLANYAQLVGEYILDSTSKPASSSGVEQQVTYSDLIHGIGIWLLRLGSEAAAAPAG